MAPAWLQISESDYSKMQLSYDKIWQDELEEGAMKHSGWVGLVAIPLERSEYLFISVV